MNPLTMRAIQEGKNCFKHGQSAMSFKRDKGKQSCSPKMCVARLQRMKIEAGMSPEAVFKNSWNLQSTCEGADTNSRCLVPKAFEVLTECLRLPAKCQGL